MQYSKETGENHSMKWYTILPFEKSLRIFLNFATTQG